MDFFFLYTQFDLVKRACEEFLMSELHKERSVGVTFTKLNHYPQVILSRFFVFCFLFFVFKFLCGVQELLCLEPSPALHGQSSWSQRWSQWPQYNESNVGMTLTILNCYLQVVLLLSLSLFN